MSEDIKKAEEAELSDQDLNKVTGGAASNGVVTEVKEIVVERITLTNARITGS